jgi:protein-disulfide isomerase
MGRLVSFVILDPGDEMNVRRNILFLLLTAFVFVAACLGADGSSLKPPAGAKVAVVVFEDLQCPDCARAYPLVWEVATAHKVPVVLHDFPLAMHNWSFDAAVYARFFDTKSQKLGDDFRADTYKNQTSITLQNLRQFVQKFADDNKVPLPFVIDPEGKLKTLVQADRELGTKIGLQHTPTIFVVANGGPPTPFVEVEDRTQLGQIIDDMEKKAAPVATPKKPAAKAHKKTR